MSQWVVLLDRETERTIRDAAEDILAVIVATLAVGSLTVLERATLEQEIQTILKEARLYVVDTA